MENNSAAELTIHRHSMQGLGVDSRRSLAQANAPNAQMASDVLHSGQARMDWLKYMVRYRIRSRRKGGMRGVRLDAKALRRLCWR